jgi:hypothetical protein
MVIVFFQSVIKSHYAITGAKYRIQKTLMFDARITAQINGERKDASQQ